MSATKPFVNLIALRRLPNTNNGTLLIHKDPSKAGGNLATLSDGVLQRSKILPAGPLPETNPKKIGFYQPNILDSKVLNPRQQFRPDFFTRKVKIFWGGNERAQKVPAIPKQKNWIVQYERQGIFKNQHMAWTFVTDTQSKRPVRFHDLEHAIEYTREMGVGYEIVYPKFRYHTRKNYGDNFKWHGPPKPEEEDL